MQRNLCALRNNLHVSRNHFSPTTFISVPILGRERLFTCIINVSSDISTLSLIKFLLPHMSLIPKVDQRISDVFVSEKWTESESKFTMIVGGYLTRSFLSRTNTHPPPCSLKIDSTQESCFCNFRKTNKDIPFLAH